jgi:hypothetical protein
LQSIARAAQGDMQALAGETLAPLGSFPQAPWDLDRELALAAHSHPEIDELFVFSRL